LSAEEASALDAVSESDLSDVVQLLTL